MGLVWRAGKIGGGSIPDSEVRGNAGLKAAGRPAHNNEPN